MMAASLSPKRVRGRRLMVSRPSLKAVLLAPSTPATALTDCTA